MTALLDVPRVHLPDQSDSSSEEGSPRKRPRRDNGPPEEEEVLPSKTEWEHYVRSGAKLKSLAETALSALDRTKALSTITGDHNEVFSNVSTTDTTSPRGNKENNSNAAQLALEKTAECLILEKKLKESDVHSAAMLATNTSLRESANASQERMERTVEALRIAGTNAANARADADAAEAYAASLANQLDSLRTVVEETKRTTKILHDEHEQIAASTRAVEAKLLQRETEFVHMQKERKAVLGDCDKLKHSMQDLVQEKKKLEFKLERKEEQINSLSREAADRRALEQARKARSNVVEKELIAARSILVDASATAAETELTTATLKEAIETLQTENKSLHTKIEEILERSREKEVRLQETLANAEKNAQDLRLQATSHNEKIQRVLSEKTGCEKQVAQLKTRVTNLERRLKETASFLSPTMQKTDPTRTPSTGKSSRSAFSIPSLTPTADKWGKSPAHKNSASKSATKSASKATSKYVSKSATCCICNKSASGLMKSCQCGNRDCDKRAHSTCLGGNSHMSLSHPGTPSPRLPVVLCSND